MTRDRDQYDYEDRGPDAAYRYVARPRDGRRIEYMTNGDGEGLFLRSWNGEITQARGTAQFRVASLDDFRHRIEGYDDGFTRRATR